MVVEDDDKLIMTTFLLNNYMHFLVSFHQISDALRKSWTYLGTTIVINFCFH